MKRPVVASILILLALSVFVFPVESFGSSVFYLSLAFFVCALLAASWKGGIGRGLEYLRLAFRLKDAPRLLLESVVLFFACGITTMAVSGIFLALGMLDTQAVYEKMMMLPLPVLVAAFTFAPLAEETMFRGFLFRKTEGWLARLGKGAWVAAALLSSLVFALLHASYGSVAEVGVAFAIGAVLCIGTKRFDSLWPAVLAHCAFNLVSVAAAVLM